jgi:MFS family permease
MADDSSSSGNDTVVWTIEAPSGTDFERASNRRLSVWMQVFALVACALASTGFYFSYDVPGVLAGHLIEWFNDESHAGARGERWLVDDSHIGLLYSFGTVPSVFGVLLTGAWIDSYGLRTVSCTCVTLVLVGSFLFASAAQHGVFTLALIGRFVLGLGGDSISVCTNSILCRYFSQKQLVAAIGVVSTFLVFADFSAFTVLPGAATRWGLLSPLWLVTTACTLSLMAILSFWLFDSRFRKTRGAQSVEEAAADTDDEAMDAPAASEPQQASVLATLPVVLRLFDARFWLLVCVGAILSATASTFNGFSVDILMHQGLDEVTAGKRTSLLSLSNLVATPLLGCSLGGMSPRAIGFMLAAALLSMSSAFLYMATVPGDTSVSLCVVGFSFGLLTTGVWPLLPLVSPSKFVGMSFGVAFSAANLFISVLYWLCGWIIKTSPELMLAIWCAVTLVGVALALAWVSVMRRSAAPATAQPHPPPTKEAKFAE